MTLAILFSAVALTCYIALMLITIRQNRRSSTNRAFALYLAAMTFWQFTALMVSFSRDPTSALFWYRFMTAGMGGQFIFYAFFTLVFLQLPGQRTLFAAGWVIFIALLASSRTNLVIDSVSAGEGAALHLPRFGPLVPAVSAGAIFFLGYGAYRLIQGYRNARSDLLRNRIKYLLLGTAVIAAGSFTNLAPLFRPYPIDVAANVLNALLIAYAIHRYQLLDITLVVRKGLLYSIPTALIGASYFLIVHLAVSLFHMVAEYQILLLSLSVAAVTAVAIQPLRNRVQSWVDRLFFRDRYDSSLMLQRLSGAAASILDLDRLTGMILDELTTTMHVQRSALFLKGERGDQFRLIAQRGLHPHTDVQLRSDHPIADWLLSHRQLLTRADVDVIPHFKALWGPEREDLERLGAELLVGLKVEGNLVGIFAVGPKLSQEPYSQEDQLALDQERATARHHPQKHRRCGDSHR